jgi:hypothetical protein
LSLVGILPDTATGASLAQQIPAAVKLDRDAFQAQSIGLESVSLCRVGSLPAQQGMFLIDERLDSPEDRFIVHERTIPHGSRLSAADQRKSLRASDYVVVLANTIAFELPSGA